jgi:4-amino-4-deoxy-L-arabinose transferase-like glycosyltransferase
MVAGSSSKMIHRNFSALVAGLVLLTAVTRLPALLHPTAIDDEGMYSVVANEIVDGGKLYLDVVDRKPPFLFWSYAALFELAGKYNWKALHVVTVLWTLGTMAGLYAIGRRLFDRATGLVAALLYCVFQPWATSKNLALNGELLMNLPIVWGWAFGLRRNASSGQLLLAGALLGTAFLFKQPAAIAAVPLGFYLLMGYRRGPDPVSPGAAFAQAACLTIGFFTVLGLVTFILWEHGTLPEAFYWVFTDHTIPHVFWDRAFLHTLAFIGACLPLVLGGAMALRNAQGIWDENKPERAALIGLLAASAIGAAAGARFYPHYYIQLIPPLALLGAPYYARLWSKQIKPPHSLLKPQVTQAWVALTAVGFFTAHWISLASQRAPSEAGEYLREHSAVNDRIFVWGQESRVYLDARRRPACRYITTFPLTGYIFGGDLPGLDTTNRILPGAWSILEQDFARHAPAYIVQSLSERDRKYPMSHFPILANLVAAEYRPILRNSESVIYQRVEAVR